MVSAEDELWFFHDFEGGIGACHKPLGSGFLVAGCAVDLACEVEAGYAFGFQSKGELGRGAVVVFNGVSGSDDLCVFETCDRLDEVELDIIREGS